MTQDSLRHIWGLRLIFKTMQYAHKNYLKNKLKKFTKHWKVVISSTKRGPKIKISYNLKGFPTLIRQKNNFAIVSLKTNQINLYLKYEVPLFYSIYKKLV